MLGAGLQVNRYRTEDRLYNPAKARRNYHNNNNNSNNNNQSIINNKKNKSYQFVEKTQLVVVDPLREVEKREPGSESGPTCLPVEENQSNVERFLEAITPVFAQYLSKTTMRGWRTCDVEFQPYFMLNDLWESFNEWSAYGAGVPLVLNGSDSVIQYYVPYLSAIQIYVDPSKSSVKLRRSSEDSDGDCLSRDSSSDGSSDSERDRSLTYPRGNQHIQSNGLSQKMERLYLKDQHCAIQEEFSSDDGEIGNAQGCLLFEYLERDPPFCREPLADKISDLASRFPELKTLRSCDVLCSSWFSVAWYPIYRIPIGQTLKDLDACFLTYHSLYTPVGDAAAQAPVVVYPNEIDGIPRISLPVFGLASYKFRGPLWMSHRGNDRQLVNTLSVSADNWLRVLQVNHPDYLFFCRGNR